MHQDESI
jgi:hypothetical protein